MRVRIGLEIHAQLETKSKMFCSCPVVFEAPPNTCVCPVCLGYPGSLPVMNAEAVRLALRFARAVGAKIREPSIQERKNYFYPDLPKGYQISQYRLPFAEGGEIAFWTDRLQTVGLRRIQLEEDTAKMVHMEDRVLVDFNRAGVPLLEIVTEPTLSSVEEAVGFLIELRNILRLLGVCRGNFEEGTLRAEPNISLEVEGRVYPRVELKNLGSIRGLQLGIRAEIRRQMECLERGEPIVQETRGLDARRGVTYPMRVKEAEEDYRYFPEPDLPPLWLPAFPEESIPEFPAARRRRWKEAYGLPDKVLATLANHPPLGDYFEEAISALRRREPARVRALAHWIAGDLRGLLQEEVPRFPAKEVARLVEMVEDGEITGKAGKLVLQRLVDEGGRTEEWVQRLGLQRIRDEAQISQWVEEAMAELPDAVEKYCAGKAAALQALVGAVMKRSRGRADPRVTVEILKRRLEAVRQ